MAGEIILTETPIAKGDGSFTAVGDPITGAVKTEVAGGATAAKQDEIKTLVGAINETAPATDTASSGLNGRIQRACQRLTSLIALLPASLGLKASTASFSTVSNLGRYGTSGAIARASGATPYTAGDVKGATASAFEITGLGNPNETISIDRVVMKIAVNAVPSGMTTFKLRLYSATPPSALADNAAFTGTGDESIYQGYIATAQAVVFGGQLRSESSGNAMLVRLSSTGSLFCYIETVGAYTPTSGALTTVDAYSYGG